MRASGQAQEGEPEQHGRAEGLADLAGAGVLYGEQQRDDQQGDDGAIGLLHGPCVDKRLVGNIVALGIGVDIDDLTIGYHEM